MSAKVKAIVRECRCCGKKERYEVGTPVPHAEWGQHQPVLLKDGSTQMVPVCRQCEVRFDRLELVEHAPGKRAFRMTDVTEEFGNEIPT